MKFRKNLIAALGASVAITSSPAAANDAAALIGGALIGGIIVNEVNKNKQRKAAPRSSGRTSSGASSAQRQQNREVQSALNTFGFPVGGVDGVLGGRSRAAIRDYQSYMGYPTTGYLDDYQRSVLVGGMHRYNSGGGAAYPNVLANEGTRGLLKAFNDPNYANQYRGGNGQSGQYAGSNAYNGGYDNNQSNFQQAGSGTVPVNRQAGTLDGSLPPIDLSRGSAPSSMATHCEVVAGLTQVNGGVMLAVNINDPEQALGEQFCEARSYAITESQSMLANARATEEQISGFCGQIKQQMQPAIAAMSGQDVKFVATKAQEIANRIYKGDMKVAADYGRICLGVGYRQDDAQVALGGALSLVAAGQMPYSEVMGHHMRWGFGTAKSWDSSTHWYETGLDAMDQGAQPAFLPSKTAERNAIIRAAISASDNGLAPIEAAAGNDGVALPELNLGGN